jgi:hypothetical protein
MGTQGTDQKPSQTSRDSRRRWRWAALLVVLVASGMGLAACGGGPPSASSPPSSASGSSSSLEAQLLKFAACMRAHGDPGYPDPVIGSDGQPHLSGPPPQGSQAQAALAACRKYTPGGSETPAEQAAALAKAVKFAECMRAHGEPDFPDPTSSGGFNFTPQDGIDPSSPQFQAAQRVCQSLDPGLHFQVSGGAGSPSGSGS